MATSERSNQHAENKRRVVKRRKSTADVNYNRREFLALTSLALSLPAMSFTFAKSSREIQCLVYDDQGQPLPPSAFEGFHLCDSLIRPFTTSFETAAGRVRFIPPDKLFRIGLPLSLPGFGQALVYADNSGDGYTGRTLADTTPHILNYALARDRMATVRGLPAECKQRGVVISPEIESRIDSAQAALTRAERRPRTGRHKFGHRWKPWVEAITLLGLQRRRSRRIHPRRWHTARKLPSPDGIVC